MHALRQFLALAALSISTLAAATPKYTPLKFSDMVFASNLIVHGEIVALSEDTFALEVSAVLAGELTPEEKKANRIEVQRFHNWTCASRWTAYAEGQRVMLLLEVRSGKYRIQSGGGEGEMPILQVTNEEDESFDLVVVRGRATRRLGYVKVPGDQVDSRWRTTVTLKEFESAIRTLHRCYTIKRLENGPYRERRFEAREQPKQAALVEEFKKSSKLGALLVEKVREFQVIESAKD